MNFDQAFDVLIGFEGGYVNHPSDPGGETNWGVTKRVAAAHGYQGEMRMLPRETAKAIYRESYWDSVQADKLPEVIRYTIFDAAVNSGPKRAIEWLRRALDLGDDGGLDPLAWDALNKAPALRLGVLFNAERLDFLTSLPTWGAFGRGWARRVVDNLKGLCP